MTRAVAVLTTSLILAPVGSARAATFD